MSLIKKLGIAGTIAASSLLGSANAGIVNVNFDKEQYKLGEDIQVIVSLDTRETPLSSTQIRAINYVFDKNLNDFMNVIGHDFHETSGVYNSNSFLANHSVGSGNLIQNDNGVVGTPDSSGWNTPSFGNIVTYFGKVREDISLGDYGLNFSYPSTRYTRSNNTSNSVPEAYLSGDSFELVGVPEPSTALGFGVLAGLGGVYSLGKRGSRREERD